jgi:hypothetical protein
VILIVVRAVRHRGSPPSGAVSSKCEHLVEHRRR